MSEARDIEKYTKDYAKGDFCFENILVKYRRRKVLEILNDYKPLRILEIGCGKDSIANYYKDFDKFVIVEPSREFAEQAIKNDDKNIELHIDFVENKVDELKKEKFDFILLSCLLHEISNPQIFLKQIISLCNKYTILHINVPNSHSFHLLWAYEAGLIEKLDELTQTGKLLQQNTTFNLDKLQTLATKVGLRILDKGSYFIKPFNHKKMSVIVNEKIIDNNLLDALYNLTKYMPELGCEIFVNCRVK